MVVGTGLPVSRIMVSGLVASVEVLPAGGGGSGQGMFAWGWVPVALGAMVEGWVWIPTKRCWLFAIVFVAVCTILL